MMDMGKTDIEGVRLSPHLRKALEEAAHARHKSLAGLLEEIAEKWLAINNPAPRDFWKQAAALRAATRGRPQTDSAELIRRDRDRDR
jgi:predicted DNA-binding protein